MNRIVAVPSLCSLIFALVACASPAHEAPPPALEPSAAIVTRTELSPAEERTSLASRDAASDRPSNEGAMAAKAGAPDKLEGKPADVMFPDRESIEALDRLSRSTEVLHEREGDVIRLQSDDLFEPGATTLSALAIPRLDAIAMALARQHGRRIVVRGFTDSLGDPRERKALSFERARAVANYLQSKGAPADMEAEGQGADRPLADNATPYGRAINRRIEIAIAKPTRAPL